MEASVDLSSPKKASRPAYRPMWEQAERELTVNRVLLAKAKAEARYYWRNLVGFAIVVLAEALALLFLAAR